MPKVYFINATTTNFTLALNGPANPINLAASTEVNNALTTIMSPVDYGTGGVSGAFVPSGTDNNLTITPVTGNGSGTTLTIKCPSNSSVDYYFYVFNNSVMGMSSGGLGVPFQSN